MVACTVLYLLIRIITLFNHFREYRVGGSLPPPLVATPAPNRPLSLMSFEVAGLKNAQFTGYRSNSDSDSDGEGSGGTAVGDDQVQV